MPAAKPERLKLVPETLVQAVERVEGVFETICEGGADKDVAAILTLAAIIDWNFTALIKNLPE
jgi:hypothetical protein